MSVAAFTIEAHPKNLALVVYRYTVDGATVWASELPADDYRSRLNRDFPATDTRDGSIVNWQPSPAQLADANATAIRDKLQQALTANTAFLALGAPTNAQVVVQVRALTRECNGLIRMALNALADVTDT